MLYQNKTKPFRIGRGLVRRISYGALFGVALLFTIAFYGALIWGITRTIRFLANLIWS